MQAIRPFNVAFSATQNSESIKSKIVQSHQITLDNSSFVRFIIDCILNIILDGAPLAQRLSEASRDFDAYSHNVGAIREALIGDEDVEHKISLKGGGEIFLSHGLGLIAGNYVEIMCGNDTQRQEWDISADDILRAIDNDIITNPDDYDPNLVRVVQLYYDHNTVLAPQSS